MDHALSVAAPQGNLVVPAGIEPATFPMSRGRSTTEPRNCARDPGPRAGSSVKIVACQRPSGFPGCVPSPSLRTESLSEAASGIWWTLPDLNRPPPPCHGGALPDELKARIVLSRGQTFALRQGTFPETRYA